MKKIYLEKSKDGYDVLGVEVDDKKVYLGSRYNAKREIETLINEIDIKNKNIMIFGLGSGSYINELISKCKYNNVLIIEPNPDIIDLYNKNVDSEYKNLRVISLDEAVNSKILVDYCNIKDEDSAEIYCFANYKNLFKEEIREFLKAYKTAYADKNINTNTRIAFSKVFFESAVKTLSHLGKARIVNEYKDILKNQPAIIVSAGPSLAKNIDQLLKVKSNFTIIPSGRTVGKLYSMGIKPTVFATMDPGEVAYNLVSEYLPKLDAPMLCYEYTNERVVRDYEGEKIYFFRNKELSSLVGTEVEDLTSGGSVAHISAKFAAYMGCNPIIFIGQDCAFTGNKIHAEDLIRKGEFTDDVISKDGDFYVEAVDGGKVRTDYTLDGFRRYMEMIIKENPNTTFINATEGGARIKGAGEARLEEVLERYGDDSVDANSSVNSLECILDIKKREENIARFKAKYTEKIVKLIKICDDGLRGINETIYKCKLGKNVENEIKHFNKLNESINTELMGFELLNDLLYPVYEYVRIKNEELANGNIDILELDKYIYGNIKSELKGALDVFKSVK